MTARARNLTAAIVLVGAGVWWFFAALPFRPLSRIFPQVAAAIVVVLGLILGVLTAIGHGPVIRLAEGDAGERHMRSGTLIGALVLWTALIPVGGLLPASIVGVTVLGLITFRGHHGTLRAIVIALASVLVFFALFRFVLYVPFPRGLLG